MPEIEKMLKNKTIEEWQRDIRANLKEHPIIKSGIIWGNSSSSSRSTNSVSSSISNSSSSSNGLLLKY